MADRVAADKGQSSRDHERGSEVGQDATSSVPGVPDSEVEDIKGEGRNKRRLRRTRSTSPNSKRPRKTTRNSFTCPFYVYDPKGYAACWRFYFRSVASIPQHLQRFHMQPLHCRTCKQLFVHEGERDEDIFQHACIARDTKIPGITEDQLKQIMRRPNRSNSQMENWLTLWRILFPDAAPPDSSYIKTSEPRDPMHLLFGEGFDHLRTNSLSLDFIQPLEALTNASAGFIHDENAEEGIDWLAGTPPISPASSCSPVHHLDLS